MGAKLTDIMSDKITRVHRIFETPDGEVEIDLAIRHKRITTEVQNELQRISAREFDKLSASLKKAKESSKDPQEQSVAAYADRLELKNIVCLHLEYLVTNLDIEDEKGKPLKPTYENLIALPTELIQAIKEEVDESVVPKKKQSTTSANGTQQAADSELPQVG